MNFTFEKLESIVYEEATVNALENIYKTKHMIVVEPNGLVTETIFNKDEEQVHYKANIEDIRNLYEDLIGAIDSIENIELYSDDYSRDVYLNYGFVSIKVPASCYVQNKMKISDLINSFMEERCKGSKK